MLVNWREPSSLIIHCVSIGSSNLDHLFSVARVKELLCLKIWGKPLPRNYYFMLYLEKIVGKILIILLIGLITSQCFWEWACTPVPKRRLVASVVYMGYHIIACLNQVESIINYFSWRRFQRCFLMWHAIGLEHVKRKNLNLQRKEL